jgi:hypothetical protein
MRISPPAIDVIRALTDGFRREAAMGDIRAAALVTAALGGQGGAFGLEARHRGGAALPVSLIHEARTSPALGFHGR